MSTNPIRLGISRCLLGDEVRFDGGHKQDHFLTDVLGRYVEWVPVCPEVEAGLGTPREAMRLMGNPHHPRLMTITSKHDHTQAMETMIAARLDSLKKQDLSGFVFKRGSPSCGVERVRVYTVQGMPSHNGVGIFAKAFTEQIHKYLLLAHSQQHYETMGRLVGQAERYRLKELTLKYGEHFMRALTMKATVRKHVNVLQHIVG
ncbi:MAG: DUF523 and DUF1722 domain-containing protein, partial [Nitrospirota bacterium]